MKDRASAELYGQPFTYIAQSNSFTPRAASGATVLTTRRVEGLALAGHLYTDHDRPGVVGQPMDDGILHQRLQNQAGDPELRQVLGAGNPHGQPVRKALLLQLEVEPDELQLIAQPGDTPARPRSAACATDPRAAPPSTALRRDPRQSGRGWCAED